MFTMSKTCCPNCGVSIQECSAAELQTRRSQIAKPPLILHTCPFCRNDMHEYPDGMMHRTYATATRKANFRQLPFGGECV